MNSVTDQDYNKLDLHTFLFIFFLILAIFSFSSSVRASIFKHRELKII